MRIHHIAFRTRELERVVRFYRDTFELVIVREQPGKGVWLGLEGAVLMIELAAEGEPPIPLGSREFVAFQVSEDRRHSLEERWITSGIDIESRTPHTLYLRDPDGRRVGVSSYPFERD